VGNRQVLSASAKTKKDAQVPREPAAALCHAAIRRFYSMSRLHLLSVLLLVGLVPFEAIVWDRPLFAQGNRTGLSPEDQKRYDDLIRSAKRNEMIGYIAIGVGILFLVTAIPLGIYLDRRKKARQRAIQAEAQGPENTASPEGSSESEN
jgi:hypothetical protein